MEILNVYVITYGPHRIPLEMDCIRHAEIAARNSPMDVKIYVCDNGSPEEFTSWVKEKYTDHDIVVPYLHPENIGKARIVNLVHKKIARKSDWFCSLDSDIVIASTNDFFEKMKLGWGAEVKFSNGTAKNVGIVSSTQLEHPCHQWKFITGSFNIGTDEFKYSTGGGIAGGCILMSTNLWDKIGGYYETTTIFGGNDGYIMGCVKRMGMMPVVSMSALAKHLGVHDTPELKKFHQWKVQQARTLGNGEGFKTNTGYFDK